MKHVPVLKSEVLTALNLKAGMNVVDATLGDAGHAEEILKLTAPNGRLLGIDVDPEGLLRAKKYLYKYGDRVSFVRANFRELADIVERERFGPIHGILIDLGWSTPQFDERGRGFSFLKDESLDMRFGGKESDTLTAAQVVNKYSADELEQILKEYGEERQAAGIAEAVVEARKSQEISTSGQLTEIVLQFFRKKLGTDKEIPWVGGIHPATKVFQALRIEVNQELEALKEVLPQIIDVLEPGGRAAIISFHSLEDRIVKHFFKSQSKTEIKIITKKPIVASEEECEVNPPSRSAKMRVIEKL